jgi:excisionase family DNA binding protein
VGNRTQTAIALALEAKHPVLTGRSCYSVPEAAQKLGVNVKTAYDGIKAGQIPSIRIGRRILVPIVPFDKMLEEPRSA